MENKEIAFFVKVPETPNVSYMMGFRKTPSYLADDIRNRVSVKNNIPLKNVQIYNSNGIELDYNKTIAENGIVPMEQLVAVFS